VLLALAACDDARPREPADDRAGRFAELVDLILFHRPDDAGGPFLLGRFEVTRRRYDAFLRATERQPPPRLLSAWSPSELPPQQADLPVTHIDLAEARAYAAWHACRLPTEQEWTFAKSVGGQYLFPWGDRPRDAWANTGALGLGFLTPVGAFESGRQQQGPYDLLGNAAEWTETVRPTWLLGICPGRGAWANPALAAWSGPGLPWPLLWALQHRPDLPRVVVGGGFLGCAGYGDGNWRGWPATTAWQYERPAAEWCGSTGCRVAADAGTVLRGLLRAAEPLAEPALAAVEAFLAQPRHAELLRAEWPRVRAAAASSPGRMLEWLEARLR
jgi:hypothetical protein